MPTGPGRDDDLTPEEEALIDKVCDTYWAFAREGGRRPGENWNGVKALESEHRSTTDAQVPGLTNEQFHPLRSLARLVAPGFRICLK